MNDSTTKEQFRDKNIIIGQMTLRGIIAGVVFGPLAGAIIGVPVYIIGAGFGLIYGCTFGLFIGILMGTVAGIVTVIFFYPLHSTWQYRLVLGIICSFGSTVFIYSGVSTLLAGSGTPLVAIAAVCALLLGLIVSQSLAGWYIKRSPAIQTQ
jgi:hypothetical protein